MPTIRPILLALAVACLAAPTAHASASPWFVTPNLVQNPGAELGAAAQGGLVPAIASWRYGALRATVVRYGTPAFPTAAQSAAVGGGAAFFAGGPADGHDDGTSDFSRATLVQDVQIRDKLDDDGRHKLDDGGTYAVVSACLGGYAGQDDRADLRVTTYGLGGEGGHVTLEGPRAAERNGATGLLPRTATLWLPPLTDTLEIALEFQRESGVGTYNDGYADNVSVRIAVADGTEPETACTFDAPPAPAPGDAAPAPRPPDPATPVASGGSAASSSTAGVNTAVALKRVGNRVRLRHGMAVLKLRCAARGVACAGSVALKTRLGKLGSARFKIGAGKVATIAVKLSRTMRHRVAALSRARLARLAVTATARIGAAKTTFVYRAAP
jgi:hypothetical protein